MIPLRLYIYAAICLALAGILWHDHHQTARANRLAVEVNKANATLTAERENTRKANEASERFAITLENLKAARAATPVRAVRLCNAAPVVRAGSTATGADAPAAGELPPSPGQHPRDRWSDDGPDIGPQLYQLADEADVCPAQLGALQDWVRNR